MYFEIYVPPGAPLLITAALVLMIVKAFLEYIT